MDFLLGIMVGVGIGFLWGVWRATQSFIERIIERPEEIREIMARLDREAKLDAVESEKKSEPKQEYRTEWHQGVCYLYDSKDNFMAQGANVIEAMANAERRFPGLKLNFRVNDLDKSCQ